MEMSTACTGALKCEVTTATTVTSSSLQSSACQSESNPAGESLCSLTDEDLTPCSSAIVQLDDSDVINNQSQCSSKLYSRLDDSCADVNSDALTVDPSSSCQAMNCSQLSDIKKPLRLQELCESVIQQSSVRRHQYDTKSNYSLCYSSIQDYSVDSVHAVCDGESNVSDGLEKSVADVTEYFSKHTGDVEEQATTDLETASEYMQNYRDSTMISCTNQNSDVFKSRCVVEVTDMIEDSDETTAIDAIHCEIPLQKVGLTVVASDFEGSMRDDEIKGSCSAEGDLVSRKRTVEDERFGETCEITTAKLSAADIIVQTTNVLNSGSVDQGEERTDQTNNTGPAVSKASCILPQSNTEDPLSLSVQTDSQPIDREHMESALCTKISSSSEFTGYNCSNDTSRFLVSNEDDNGKEPREECDVDGESGVLCAGKLMQAAPDLGEFVDHKTSDAPMLNKARRLCMPKNFYVRKYDEQCNETLENESLLVKPDADSWIKMYSETANFCTGVNSRNSRSDWLVAALKNLYDSDSTEADVSMLDDKKKELCNKWIGPLANELNRILAFFEITLEIASSVRHVKLFRDFEDSSVKHEKLWCDHVVNDVWRRASYCYARIAYVVDMFMHTKYEDLEGIEHVSSLYGSVQKDLSLAIVHSKTSLNFFLRLTELFVLRKVCSKDLSNRLQTLRLQSAELEQSNAGKQLKWFSTASTATASSSSTELDSCMPTGTRDDEAHLVCPKICICQVMCSSTPWCLYDSSFCPTSELRKILERVDSTDRVGKAEAHFHTVQSVKTFCSRWLSPYCQELEEVFARQLTLIKNMSKPETPILRSITDGMKSAVYEMRIDMDKTRDCISKLSERSEPLTKEEVEKALETSNKSCIKLSEGQRLLRGYVQTMIEITKTNCVRMTLMHCGSSFHHVEKASAEHRDEKKTKCVVTQACAGCGTCRNLVVPTMCECTNGTLHELYFVPEEGDARGAVERVIHKRWKNQGKLGNTSCVTGKEKMIQFLCREFKLMSMNADEKMSYFAASFDNDSVIITKLSRLSVSSLELMYKHELLMLLANRQRELYQTATNLLWMSLTADDLLRRREAEQIDMERTITLLCQVEQQQREMCNVQAKISALTDRLSSDEVLTLAANKKLEKEMCCAYCDLLRLLTSVKNTMCKTSDEVYGFISRMPACSSNKSNGNFSAKQQVDRRREVVHNGECLSLINYETLCAADLTEQDLGKLIKEIEHAVVLEQCSCTGDLQNLTDKEVEFFLNLFACQQLKAPEDATAGTIRPADEMPSTNDCGSDEYLSSGIRAKDYFHHMMCDTKCFFDTDMNVIELYVMWKSDKSETMQKFYNGWISALTRRIWETCSFAEQIAGSLSKNPAPTWFCDLYTRLLTIKNEAESNICALLCEAIKSGSSMNRSKGTAVTSVEEDWRVRFISVCTQYDALNKQLKKIVLLCYRMSTWILKIYSALGHEKNRGGKLSTSKSCTKIKTMDSDNNDVETSTKTTNEVHCSRGVSELGTNASTDAVKLSDHSTPATNDIHECVPTDLQANDSPKHTSTGVQVASVEADSTSVNDKLSVSVKLFHLLKDLVNCSHVKARQAKVVFCNQWLAPLLSKLSEAARMCDEMKKMISLVPGIPCYQETVDSCTVLVDEVKLSVERLVDKVLSITVDDEDTPAERQLYEDYRNIKTQLKDLIKTVREKLDWLQQCLGDQCALKSKDLLKRLSLSAYVEYCNTAEGLDQIKIKFVRNSIKKSSRSGAQGDKSIQKAILSSVSSSKAKANNGVKVDTSYSQQRAAASNVQTTVCPGDRAKHRTDEQYHFDEYSLQGVKGKKGPVFQQQAACLTKRKHRPTIADDTDPAVVQCLSQSGKPQPAVKEKAGYQRMSKESQRLPGLAQGNGACGDDEAEFISLIMAKHDPRRRMKAIRAQQRASKQKRDRE